ncbi:DUF1269 domain-containing protein [Dictyobacter aurantiacus]|uniref:Membrane protein n=1 Tax=Dictyobacter aurantiacus TaxID=1936993 RepID=A0A401ZJ63_9CHLR|nr:DUF1269 domain-containing protein [Dictyobacter aurantiacus]GCE06883.1 membrane protein [Dictyobacter aurantiacus]
MSHLFVLEFNDEASAQQVVDTLKQLQQQQLIKLDDAAIYTKEPDGKPRIRQLHNLVGAGAMGGAFWGLLVGLLFLSPLLGAAVGASAGALAGKFTDIGIDDKFIKEIGDTVQPGQSALFLLTSNAVADKVVPALKNFQFKLLRTSLSNENEQKLRDMISSTTTTA